MKRRSGEIQVFSMSFLDVLSCALGGTLLLLLLIQQSQQQQTAAREEAARQMQARIEASQRDLQQTQKQLEESLRKAKTVQQQLAAVKQANAKLKKAQTALTGLGGPLKNVVFIFDTSGSMADDFGQAGHNPNNPKKGPRFVRYLDSLKKGVKSYPISRLNVVRFSHTIEVWKPGQMIEASDANRDAANRFIDTFKPYGGTATMNALQAALKLPDVDTVILFSDGVPTPTGKTRFTMKDVDDEIQRINTWVQANRGKTVINTVAIGGTHESKHREFLRNLAKLTGGTSQAIF